MAVRAVVFEAWCRVCSGLAGPRNGLCDLRRAEQSGARRNGKQCFSLLLLLVFWVPVAFLARLQEGRTEQERNGREGKKGPNPLSTELWSGVASASMLNKSAKRDLVQPPGVTSHITSGGRKRPRTRPKRTAAERNYRLTVVGSIDSLRWVLLPPPLPLSLLLPLSSAMPTNHAPIALASKSLRRHRHGDDTATTRRRHGRRYPSPPS